MGVNPVRVVALTQPVDQQWRNAKVLRTKPQHAKNFIKEGELEKMSDLAEKQSQIWV